MTSDESYIAQLRRWLHQVPSGTELVITQTQLELWPAGSLHKHLINPNSAGWGMQGEPLASAPLPARVYPYSEGN